MVLENGTGASKEEIKKRVSDARDLMRAQENSTFCSSSGVLFMTAWGA